MSNAQDKALSIDVGGTSVKFAVIQGTEILDRGTPLVTQKYETPGSLIEAITRSSRELLARHPETRAAGVGLPGFVNHAAGTVDSLTNIAGWHNIEIRKLISDDLGLPVAVDNDANCMAYAEWKFGAGKGYSDLVCLTLGTGVGSGIIVNNKMLHGHLGAAGELGQTCIDYRGRVGHYGNRGALEDYIGNRELAADAQAAYAAAGIPKTIEECSPMALEINARAGDLIALKEWDTIGQKLAAALLNCCYILNPQAFVIGGGIANARDLLFLPLRKHLKAQLYPSHYEAIRILPAWFKSEAGLIGAARLALDTLD